MENFVCKGQLFFSTGPNGHRCIPNGFLVCTEGLCQGAFPVLPEAYRDLPPSGLRGPAHPPRVGGSPPPRAPVCLSGSGDGPGAAGLAEHPHLPGGSQVPGPGLRRACLPAVCGGLAGQLHHPGRHLCHRPHRCHLASHGPAGGKRTHHPGGPGQHGPGLP